MRSVVQSFAVKIVFILPTFFSLPQSSFHDPSPGFHQVLTPLGHPSSTSVQFNTDIQGMNA